MCWDEKRTLGIGDLPYHFPPTSTLFNAFVETSQAFSTSIDICSFHSVDYESISIHCVQSGSIR
jgi:hypothetical protein